MDTLQQKISGKEMRAWIKEKGEQVRTMTIEQISENFSGREFDELAMIEAGRVLNVCNYKANKNIEKLENDPEIEKLEHQRKQEAYKFLQDNNIDTTKNKALIEAVKFSKEGIKIGGVIWEHENLKKDDVRLKTLGLNYTNYNEKVSYYTPQIYKGEGTYADEDYYNFAMVEQLNKSLKLNLPTKEDMEKALTALLGGKSGNLNRLSYKLFAILMGCQESGSRGGLLRNNRDTHGCLWSVSSPYNRGALSLTWFVAGGDFMNSIRDCALPVRCLVWHS